jgi:ABC-type Na+ transport system ATPase subunit NatA
VHRMNVDIEISNYRCFTAPTRARLTLDGGVVALVGPNNAGKSALLRFFYEFRHMFQLCAGNVPDSGMNLPLEVTDALQLFSNANGDDILVSMEFGPLEEPLPSPTHPTYRISYCDKVEIMVRRQSFTFELTRLRSHAGKAEGPIRYSGPFIASSNANIAAEFDMRGFQRVSAALGDSLYLGPFRNIVNIGANNNYFDVQVGDAFVREWVAAYNGSRGTTAALTAKGVSNEIERIFQFARLEIIATEGSQTLQLFVNGQPYRLNELGSGLAQFILVLYTAARWNPSLLLIDEPESNLHPTLQLDFLTALAAYTKPGGLGTVIATHSLGLATAANGRIYSVSRQEQNQPSRVRDFDALDNPTELLGEMSYAGRYDLGLRKVLLVEGSTDIKLMQQFLRKLDYDHQVAIIPLGGSSLISRHALRPLVALLRMTRNLYAIVDREADEDASTGKSIKTFSRICERLRIPCHVLQRRAIENYLTDPAVSQIMGTAIKPLGSSDPAPKGWSKTLNWRVARAMPLSDIIDTDLGIFLQRIKAEPTNSLGGA